MCSGKSTLGRALARRLGWRFIDLDSEIESAMSMTVSEIFRVHGPETFRQYEIDTLRKVAERYANENVVIAVGGGTPCFADNMDVMNRSGLTVFLEAPVSRLVERLLIEGHSRPLVAGKSAGELTGFVSSGLEDRMTFYKQARHRFDSSRLENQKMIDESVNQFIDQIINR